MKHWVSVLAVRWTLENMSGSRLCGLLSRPGVTTTMWASFLVHFRYVVFHPFLDEILIGKIKGCSPEGVHGKVL